MGRAYRCKACKKQFPNGKSWGGHIRACYKKKEKEDYEDMDTSSSDSKESEFEFQDENQLEETVQVIDLRAYLPQGWSKASKKRTGLDDDAKHEKLIRGVDDVINEKLLSLAAKNLLSLPIRREEEKGLKVEDGVGEFGDREKMYLRHLGVNKKPMKNNGSGGPRKYICKECGQDFPSFQGLGGHLAAHNRKKLKERAAEFDAVHQDSTGKNNQIGFAPGGKLYKCNLCGKSFTSGQALGGHKSYHSSAHMGMGYVTHSAVSSKETSHDEGEVSHPDPPGRIEAEFSHPAPQIDAEVSYPVEFNAEVSHPDPPLRIGAVFDLNIAPDGGSWGTEAGIL